MGDPVDGLIILTIIVASGLLGFVQERRADSVMADLLARVKVRADVLRDTREVEVAVDEVVLGDVVVLRAGDIVPADLRLLESVNLLVDESSVTGESTAVEKTADASPAGGESTLPRCAAFLGTHIVSGSGTGVAVTVGPQTRFGSLVNRLEAADVTTKFEQEMTSFGLMLTRVMLALVTTILIINFVLHRPFVESLMFALALAVGITAQLLPAIVVVSLSMGARQLATESVLVKRLDAIEDVGGMSMLCSDKTGTLTRGVVDLDRAIDLERRVSARVLRFAALNATLQRGYPNAMDVAIGHSSPVLSGSALVDEVPTTSNAGACRCW